MIRRFYLYSVFKNLRFSDPFLVLYFLDQGLSFLQMGWLFALQHLVTVLLEFPSGMLADRWGRRRCLAVCFLCYAVSLIGFGVTDHGVELSPILWYGGCLSFFAIGEAFRTGTHKAIMLDYLDSSRQTERSTQIVGMTRSISKFSSATAAICAGLLLFWLRNYDYLFFLSAVSSVCGFFLMLSYPRELEGERQREGHLPSTTSILPVYVKLYRSGKRRRFWSLVVQSVLFESQVKIVLKYYLQPFLRTGLGLYGIAIAAPKSVAGIAGSGAVWVGLNEFVRDSLGGVGARLSSRYEKSVRNRTFALNRIYLGGIAVILGVAVCSLDLAIGLIPGLMLVVGLTVLQNLRRPLFVTAFNDTMEKSRRATALSLESVARSLTVAGLLPLFGWVTDSYGLMSVWILSASLMVVGVFLQPKQDEDSWAGFKDRNDQKEMQVSGRETRGPDSKDKKRSGRSR